jgi:hypothetical protein
MPVRTLKAALYGGLGVGVLFLAFGLYACPFAHDSYETDRSCWDQLDCVSSELCFKVDGGQTKAGRCAPPSDGPCVFDGGATEPGFHCFPDLDGTERYCYYEPRYSCRVCQRDAGPLPDSGQCPTDWCLEWNDRWGCR